jgi:demethylmenaquinone methyltransferase/2-methoxy-6-polyprenyl-1,4-benzoquinol methylase
MSAVRSASMAALSPAGHAALVREIFTTSHRRYDLLNRLLSFRRDVGWREAAAALMRFGASGRLLDVATGTADLAIAAARRHPRIAVTGIDFAQPMLEIGRRKADAAGLGHRITLQEADACALPFADASFDVAAVAFGMRNFPDKLRALREMRRVTAPGGRVMVLEMSFAPSSAFRPFYGFYLGQLLPRIARLFANGSATYEYLGDSIRHFLSPNALAALMREAGLEAVACRSLTFGAAWLHIGRVPGGA